MAKPNPTLPVLPMLPAFRQSAPRPAEITALSRPFGVLLSGLLAVIWSTATGSNVVAQQMEQSHVGGAAAEVLPSPLTLDEAVAFGLRNNPEIIAQRQQRGIAAAGVIIANTYPFNPIYEGIYRGATGPPSAGITNSFTHEHRVLLEVEIRGQRGYRQEGAAAALTRTEWEIAFLETALAVRIVRAYETVLYRQEKLRLIRTNAQLNQRSADHVRELLDAGRLRGADLILARSEVYDSLALEAPGKAALASATQDLLRALGILTEGIEIEGKLQTAFPRISASQFLELARERRADLFARQTALREAEAHVRLAVADRFGNPSIGPTYERNEANASFIGAQVNFPIPVLNTHRGDIIRLESERTRAALDIAQTEAAIHRDVQAALVRLEQARANVEFYQQRLIPNLENNLKQMEKLFEQADPGVDVLKMIDIRRKLIKARDGYADAIWELSQARADLAAAVGDPALAMHPEQEIAPPEPGTNFLHNLPHSR
jgi:outer membrane protein TolC